MSNPTFTRQQAEDFVKIRNDSKQVSLIGYRSKISQYGTYDDTIALLTPEMYVETKGNTLPSIWRTGIAKLCEGSYEYKPGLHGVSHLRMPADQKIYDWLQANVGLDYPSIMIDDVLRLIPYWAFRQNGPVTLIRDGATTTETQTNPDLYPFIDIHHGGFNLTSSEGCQTIHPDFWINYRRRGFNSLVKFSQPVVTYHLFVDL